MQQKRPQKTKRKVKTHGSKTQSLQQGLANSPSNTAEQDAKKFLLAEFQHIGELWRHTDSRLESGLNLYVAASTLVVSGLAYISQNVNPLVFLVAFILVGVSLLAGGIVLGIRVTGTARVKAEYMHALNRIRAYFVENHPQLEYYLVLPSANKDNLKQQQDKHNKQVSNLLFVIHTWNSFLSIAVLVSFLIALRLAWNDIPPNYIFPAIIVGVAIFIVFVLFRRNSSKRIMQSAQK